MSNFRRVSRLSIWFTVFLLLTIGSVTTVLAASIKAPTGLTATAVSSGQINTAWSSAQNATGYRLERALSSSGPWTQIGTTTEPTVYYSDTTVAGSTTYWYHVIAVDSRGSLSPASTPASATTPAAATIPAVPYALKATAVSSSQINLAWSDNATNELGYTIQRWNGSAWIQIATLGVNSTAFSNTGLAANTRYYYYVIAYNSTGSSRSITVNAMTLPSVPAAPGNLAASAVSTSQIYLTWTDNSTNETGFTVERALASSGPWTVLTTTLANAVSYSSTGLASATTYYYRIKAESTSGSSGYSNTASATTQGASTAPAAPSALTATAVSSNQINLAWTDNASNETGFKVQRWNGSAWVQIGTLSANTTTFADTGLTPNTRYYYYVIAYNSAGSGNSATVNSLTLLASLTAPGNLAASAVSTNQINLTWADNSTNETGFTVERAFASGGPWTVLTTTLANSVSFSSAGLSASTTYYYRVKAVSLSGSSGYSNTASATTQAAAFPPSAPSALTATSVSAGQINLAWTDNASNETGFKIERAAFSTGPWNQVATTSANYTSYSDTGLTASTTYYYRMSAYNIYGSSAVSNIASATTQPTTTDTVKPTVPSNMSVVAPACGVLTVAWTGSTDSGGSGLRGYKIYRSGSYYTLVLQPPPPGSAVSLTDSSLREALFYSYEISAIDNAGNESAKCPIGGTYTLSCSGAGGEYTWGQRAGGAYLPDSGSALAVDSGGNIYVVGQFQSSADFPAGTLTSAGASDVFIAKYSPDGTNLWSRRFGGPYDDLGSGIAVDGSGNLYVTGKFQGTASFGTGSMTSAGTFDIFLVKMSGSNGAVLWTKSIGGTGIDAGSADALQVSSNIALTGSFRGTVDFGGGAVANTNPWSLPFLASYSASDGSYQWVKRFGRMDGALNTQGSAFGLAIDAAGNIAIAGTFAGPVDFGGGALTNGGGLDVFVAEYTSSGAYLWAKGFGDANDQQAYGVAFDHSRNVALTGYFMGGINFGGGVLPNTAAETAFLAKLSGTSGAHMWSKSFIASSMYRDFGFGVAVDGADNVLLTGFGSGPIDFGGGPLTSDSATIFVAKFSTGGYHLWSKRFRSGGGQGNAVIADGSDNVIFTGSFGNLVDFGMGAVGSAGGDNTDFFITKLRP